MNQCQGHEFPICTDPLFRRLFEMYCLTACAFEILLLRPGGRGEDKLVHLGIEQYTVISRNLFILSLYDDVLAGVVPAVHLSVPGHHRTRQREASRVFLPSSIFRM
jgi:hypothetical protein